MKPKEYLLSIGAIKEVGRGRLSKEHIELCKKAAADGVVIEGYTVTKAKDAAPIVLKTKANAEKVIQEIAPLTYPENEYIAYEIRDGKKRERSMRSACNNCRVSLVQCHCGEPTIVATNGMGSVRVYIEGR